MISTGVVEPLGVPLVGPVNFVGYVVWSAWLVALAVVMLRQPSSRPHHEALAPAAVTA